MTEPVRRDHAGRASAFPGPKDPRAASVEASAAIVARLEKSGVRISPRRRAILSALVAEEGHLSREELGTRLRARGGRVSITTVYRFMRVLVEHGVVRAIRVGDTARFEIDSGGAHDHIVCATCGQIREVHDEGLRERVRALAAAQGFVGKEPTLEIHSMCADCSPSSPDSSDESGDGDGNDSDADSAS